MIRTNESANTVRFLRKLKDSDHPIPSGLHAACRKGKARERVPFRRQPAGSARDAGRRNSQNPAPLVHARGRLCGRRGRACRPSGSRAFPQPGSRGTSLQEGAPKVPSGPTEPGPSSILVLRLPHGPAERGHRPHVRKRKDVPNCLRLGGILRKSFYLHHDKSICQ